MRVDNTTPLIIQKSRDIHIEFNRPPSPNLTEENDLYSGRRFALEPIIK